MADEPDAPQPWDRQEGETAKAFAAFSVYRDMPVDERSLAKAAASYYHGGSPARTRQFEAWSSNRAWGDRVAAWDQHLDRTRQLTHAEEVEAMALRHADAGRLAVQRGIQKLASLLVEDMTVTQAIDAIKVGVSVERLSRGEPETTSAVEHSGLEQDAARSLLTSNPEIAAAAAELAALAANEEAKQQGEKPNVSAIRRRTSKAPKEKVSAR